MATSTTVLHSLMSTIERAGAAPVRATEQTMNADWPNAIPSPEQVFELIVRGFMPESAGEEILKWHGISLNASGNNPPKGPLGGITTYQNTWQAFLYAKSEQPELTQMLEISNRQLWDDGEVQDTLTQYGYYLDTWKPDVANLRYEIPGPSDLVRFSVRHFWEPDIISAFTYDQEFPGKIIDLWHSMKGLDYKLFTGPFKSQVDQFLGGQDASVALANTYAEAGIPEPTWANAYWYSHWILPSPTQGYLMWQRLNPDRDPKWDAPEMVGQNFGFEQLQLLLRANDYPPYFRPLLAAISHPIPGIRFMREFVRNGVYQYDDIVEWGRRQGYSPLDSKNIADDVWQATQQAKASKADKACIALYRDAYLAGIKGIDEVQQDLEGCGLSADDAALQAGEIQLRDLINRAKKVVSSIRSRFVRGKINEQQAQNLLGAAGIVPQAQADSIAEWQLEMDARGKEVTGAQLQKLACQGFISLDDLDQRLDNLGYTPDARAAIVVEARVCQTNLIAKAAAALAKAEQQAVKAQQAAVKAAASQLKQCQRSLSSHGSPSKLKEWYCQGYISEQEVSSRLRFLGWPLEDVSRLIADCKGVKDATQEGLKGRPVIPGPVLSQLEVCPPSPG